jgi:hypothetical protein
VDPEPEYLNAGETYTLDITADLASTYGETFGARTYTLTPKDSSPGRKPAILVQKLTQGTTSRLTGKPVNEVPVNGTLLGENKNITQASAEVVRAELADVTTYTDVTPIRLPKGTVLNGAEINPILIGGEVPAGFGSGDVTMTVLSDASGYLVPNPYAENNPDALRIVHLMMDVGIATSEARANGAFTQDLLHIELVGLAEVDPQAGVLNLDAVSVVEPNILGQEYGYGMLSFQLQSYKDQNNAPQSVEDDQGPVLSGQVFGFYEDSVTGVIKEKSELYEPGEPIVINFNESIDRTGVDEAVSLYENGNPVDIDVTVDGAALILKPKDSLKYSKENNRISYRLVVDPQVKDVAGNTLTSAIDETFELPVVVQDQVIQNEGTVAGGPAQETAVADHSPVVLTTYPGFPCVLEESMVDLENNIVGRCAGGLLEGTTGGTRYDITQPDDLMPLPELPENRAVSVRFSKPMNLESINSTTFFVEKKENDGYIKVDGKINKYSKRIEFVPTDPWNIGEIYRYTLKSNDSATSSAVDCTVSICSADGLPLQTQPLMYTKSGNFM